MIIIKLIYFKHFKVINEEPFVVDGNMYVIMLSYLSSLAFGMTYLKKKYPGCPTASCIIN